MKISKLILIITGLFLLNISSIYGQNIAKQDSCAVTFIIDKNQNNGILLKLNKDLFITSMDMIPKIDKSIVQKIMMYQPTTKQFKDAVSKVDSKKITLITYFEIEIKEGFETPKEFKVKKSDVD